MKRPRIRWLLPLAFVLFLPQSAARAADVTVKGPETPSAIEKFALDELADALKRLPQPGRTSKLIIVVGQAKTNPEAARLLASGFTKAEERAEGYALKYDKDRGTVLIAGADERGTLYGVMDCIHYYLRKACSGEQEQMELHEAPKVELRGLWLWGSSIYNYERFLDQMARWKMNLVISWTDPRHSTTFVAFRDYAASRGITVVWGYGWGWDRWIDWSKPESIAAWEEKAVKIFEEQYAPLNPFGIYFQTSGTEGGRLKPEDCKEVVEFVNRTSTRILEKHPKVRISFGLHFPYGDASVRARFEASLKDVDPRVNIMYEDLPGGPFAYRPAMLNKDVLTICSELASLRGDKEDIGYVYKGFFHLGLQGWVDEEPKEEPKLIRDEAKLQAKADSRESKWAEQEAGWIKTFERDPTALDVLKNLVESKAKRKSVTLLVENGLWEVRAWYPVCLLAEAMWNPYREKQQLLKELDDCLEVHSTRKHRRPAGHEGAPPEDGK